MGTALSCLLYPAVDRFPDWSALDAAGRAGAETRCRDRLATTGVALNAVVRQFPSRKPSDGKLSGLPYVVKDMISNGHVPVSWGCASPLDLRTRPATIVDALNACGATLIAAAEMTALAYEPSGVNASRGNVLNPWNQDFVPGGSSSGSAALVAAGCCDVALGSDTGGSVRIPAHCCGVTALKAGWGAIPGDGVMSLAPSLDTVGILARSAVDIALVWDALKGQTHHLRGVANATVIATVMEDTLTECNPSIAALFRKAVSVIARLGVKTVARNGFPQDADRDVLLVMQAEAARTHSDLLASDALDKVLSRRLAKGLDISDAELGAALDRRAESRDQFLARFLDDADVVLLPVMPVTTPRYRETDPSSPEFNARKLYAMSRFTRFINYLGLPALALPMGFDENHMPAALQLVGRPGSEAILLDLACRFQQQTDWHGRVPNRIAIETMTIEQG